jgi:twitching motility protein PilT
MRQLDRFIAVMLERGASAIAVAPDTPVRIQSGGRLDPLTRQPVTAEQIDAILKGGIPEHAARAYELGEGVSFSYESPGGTVQVTLDPGAGGPSLTIRPQSSEERGGNGAPDSASVAAAPPSSDPVSGATEAGSGRARAGGSRKVDALLRRLVESGGSDLHLRVGQPPILRRDGALQREESGPLSAADIRGLLDSIMSDRDREIFNRDWDADFAHEIPGVARFRVNAAMDRNGPMIVFRTIPSDIPTCADVGVPSAVQDLCLLTKGLVVVTGPTGSGKSTTLAAMVDKMNREREDHILTIEDPIEFVHQPRSAS